MSLRVLFGGDSIDLANGVWFSVSTYVHDDNRASILLTVHPRSGLTLSLHYSVEEAGRAITWLRDDHAYLSDTSTTADVSFEVGDEGARLADELAAAVAALADDIIARREAQQVAA